MESQFWVIQQQQKFLQNNLDMDTITTSADKTKPFPVSPISEEDDTSVPVIIVPTVADEVETSDDISAANAADVELDEDDLDKLDAESLDLGFLDNLSFGSTCSFDMLN